MSAEQALVPIEQKTVNFQGDDITAVLVETEEGEQVFVPVRPICDFLGVSWTGQIERINRDPVLSEVVSTVRVTRTEGQREVTRELSALPLEFLNGWLFGINASRVKEEIRDNLIRYQRDCYRILAQAFLEQRTAPGQPIGEAQAAEITQRIKALAGLLTEKDPGKNHYQSVFNEIYRLFGVTSYKLIPQAKYEAVLEFLDEWRDRITK